MDTQLKRILAANQLGISFGVADGHRYVTFTDSVHDRNIEEEYGRVKGVYPEGKVYGDLDAALDYVDGLLEEMGHIPLAQIFEDYHLGDQFFPGGGWKTDLSPQEKKQAEDRCFRKGTITRYPIDG